jgi:predicted ATP-grasp superfamily ATP-dependent carboligase
MIGPGPRVLVLDGRSGSALATVRSLGAAGWHVLAPAGSRSAASRYASYSAPVPDAFEAPERFQQAIIETVRAFDVAVVVPCTDASMSLLDEIRGELEGAQVMGASEPLSKLLRDKATALHAAAEAGFQVPIGGVPDDLAAAVRLADDVGYPCVVKPRLSAVRRGLRLAQVRHGVAYNEAELRVLLAQSEGDPPLIQELVPGRALSVGAVLRDGLVLARVARETLSFHPVGGGTSVWKRTIRPDDTGVQAALDLLLALGYEGLAEVEYQVGADGAPRLMEVGVRAFGWFPLAIAAGVNLPLIAGQSLMGEAIAPALDYRVGLEMRWLGGEILRVRDALARGRYVPPGISRRAVISRAWPPWRRGMLYDGLALDDPAPWIPARWRRHAQPLVPTPAPTRATAHRAHDG